jgi:hypothetical protein
MPRGNCTFRQRDATALLKAARDAGLPVNRVLLDCEGNLIVETKQATTAAAGEPETRTGTMQGEANEWDEVLSGRDTPKAS